MHFHLDPLWSDTEVDFVGIDLYHPLSDWRDEPGHADEASGRSPYNLDYLEGNIRGGEGFDWYYASDADRDAQVRTPITDGAGKPWVFRFKDIEAWWANAHYDRPGGVESGTATDWVAEGKPIWLTELGCPAIDKGANQPNVFFDPKSSESEAPYFSNASRDDFQQRAYHRRLSALLRSRPSALQRLEPGLRRHWRADARPGAHDALGLGCAALPVFPRSRRRVVGRRELGARALAERPARAGDARRA